MTVLSMMPPRALSSTESVLANGGSAAHVPGVHDSANLAKHKKVTILNGSHRTVCHDDEKETVLVFPDYKVVTEVDRSEHGAEALFRAAVDPAVPRAGAAADGGAVRSYVLPYACVVLLCAPPPRPARGARSH